MYCYDGDSTRGDSCSLSDGGDQNDAIRGFRASKHSIRRGDLDLGFLSQKGRPARALSFRVVFGV